MDSTGSGRVVAAPERRVLPFRFASETILWTVLAVGVLVVAIAPLLYTVDIAFYRETRLGLSTDRSLDAILDVYTTAEYLGYLAQALILAALVTVFSMVIGVAMALLMARTDLPAKGLLDLGIMMPLFLSPFTGLIAWINLAAGKTGFINVAAAAMAGALGIHWDSPIDVMSYSGVVWVMTLFFCPFAYLFTVGNLRGMDSSLEDAARTTGANVLTTLRRVTLPLALPAIFASGLLIFVLAAETYTIPGIVGATVGFTVLPWKIYLDSTDFPVRLAHAAAAGTMLLWVTAFGVLMQRRITRVSERFVTFGGKGHQSRPLRLGWVKAPALALIFLYILVADLLPFGALILSSFMRYSATTLTADLFTLHQYSDLLNLDAARIGLWNTVWLAVLCAAVCVLAGFLISFMELRRAGAWTRLLALLGVLPIAVPGVVYGVGLMWLYLRTPIYATAWILLLAYVAKFLPFAIVVSRSGILQINRELEESARMSGAGALTTLRAITLPLLKPTLVMILFFIMLMCIKELSASALLTSERGQVLSVLTWNYMASGNYQFAAAIGVVQTVIMVAIVVVTRAIFRVRLEQTVAK